MTGKHVVGADESQTGELDPDIAVEPPEQYTEPAEEHEPTGEGPEQWVEGAEDSAIESESGAEADATG